MDFVGLFVNLFNLTVIFFVLYMFARGVHAFIKYGWWFK